MFPQLPLPVEAVRGLDAETLRADIERDRGRDDGASSSSTPPRREATDEDVRRAVEFAESAPNR